MAKKISFKKKIMKGKTTSNFIIIEQPLLKSLGVEAGDLVRVIIEKIDDKKERKKIVNKALQIAAEDTGSSYVKIEYEKEKKNETK